MPKGVYHRSPRSVADRFWKKVDKSGDCWIWIGAVGAHGYGNFGGRNGGRAHRVAWELENGTIPPGLLACHKCDNPKCVRPAHIFLGTHKANTQDALDKQRPIGQPRKDFCKWGHKRTAENTRIYRGIRHCRECDPMYKKRRKEYAAKRAA